MPLLEDLFKEKNKDKLDKDEIDKACEGVMSPE
jgi:hypothetical protein